MHELKQTNVLEELMEAVKTLTREDINLLSFYLDEYLDQGDEVEQLFTEAIHNILDHAVFPSDMIRSELQVDVNLDSQDYMYVSESTEDAPIISDQSYTLTIIFERKKEDD